MFWNASSIKMTTKEDDDWLDKEIRVDWSRLLLLDISGFCWIFIVFVVRIPNKE